MVGRAPSYVPSQGDVVWCSFDPQAGHEQAGRRPAVVLSPAPYNRRVGLALVCPITSRAKGYPFEIPLPPGFAVSGVVLVDQLRSVDWRARQTEYILTLPSELVSRIGDRIASLLPFAHS